MTRYGSSLSLYFSNSPMYNRLFLSTVRLNYFPFVARMFPRSYLSGSEVWRGTENINHSI
jgi:hypothetical protein